MFPARKIVCPTDFSDGSFQALAGASELAVHFGAEVCLIHVIPFLLPTAEPGLPEQQKVLHEDAEEKLRKVAEPLTAIGLRTQIVIGEGDAGAHRSGAGCGPHRNRSSWEHRLASFGVWISHGESGAIRHLPCADNSDDVCTGNQCTSCGVGRTIASTAAVLACASRAQRVHMARGSCALGRADAPVRV
jgi:hypothetical protein